MKRAKASLTKRQVVDLVKAVDGLQNINDPLRFERAELMLSAVFSVSQSKNIVKYIAEVKGIQLPTVAAIA